jgi:hypothetical protein
VHAPDTQAAFPFPFVQVTPQLPQFVVVLVGISQPLEASPSQLPKPALQAVEQPPPLQDGVP